MVAAPAEGDPAPVPLGSRAEAEAYVASVCFKHGPPRLVGVELEWLVHPTTAPAAPLDAGSLRAALGPHAPPSLDPRSPARPLPAGSTVTVEPGGQVELASPPLAPLGRLIGTVTADTAALHARLAAHHLAVAARGSDAARPPRRLLDLPRYRAMEHCFDRAGPAGRSGMCSTAAVQVCLDAGEGAEVAQRWAALHELGPVLVAAFANSPLLHGRRTGWKSSRWACWLTLSPRRTAPPPPANGDPAAAWARRVLDTELLCVRRPDGGGWDAPPGVTFADWVAGALDTPPTREDLDYHVSTLFPPVRPHGHLEVRYVDAQPGRQWALPVAVLAALLADPGTTAAARAACRPAAGRWVAAARHGLADAAVARAAVDVFTLALAALPALGPPGWLVDDLAEALDARVRRGLAPADLDAPELERIGAPPPASAAAPVVPRPRSTPPAPGARAVEPSAPGEPEEARA